MHIDISQGFVNRDSFGVSDDVLNRIRKSYILSKKDQISKNSCYQVSREWVPIYQRYMSKYIDVLLNGSNDDLKIILNNFFRHDCSTGLHGMHFEMVQRYMSGNTSAEDLAKYLEHSSLYCNLFLKNCRPADPRVLRRPNVGNPYGYEIVDADERIFVYGGAEYHYSYARTIEALCAESSSVAELGGGFGGLASYLLLSNKIKTYIGFDLPENAVLQAFFLSAMYPDKAMALYGEIDNSSINSTMSQYDYVLLPNYCVDWLAENKIDLTFNSYSLAEMSQEAVDNYLEKICFFTKSIFYHVNHTDWPISGDAFNVDSEKFKLVFRFPTMWGKNPISPKIDHHDFVYMAK